MGTIKTYSSAVCTAKLSFWVSLLQPISVCSYISTRATLLPWKAAVSNEMAGTEGLRREWTQKESSVVLVVASHINTSIGNKSND
jgi:hypothetical protein